MRLTSIVIAKIVLCLTLVGAAQAAEQVDLLINNGVIYDGSGGNPVKGSVAVRNGRVVAVGKLADYQAGQTLDAKGLAVSPVMVSAGPLGRAARRAIGQEPSMVRVRFE